MLISGPMETGLFLSTLVVLLPGPGSSSGASPNVGIRLLQREELQHILIFRLRFSGTHGRFSDEQPLLKVTRLSVSRLEVT